MSDSSAGCARCAELQAAYDDFQQQSRELEEGLEQELQAAQKQVDTLKQRLEKANTALAAERESSKGAMTQLHSQISTLQAELSKSTALVESLKSVKRSSETVAYDHDEKLRRLEAAAQDAAERADSFAEEAVLLKVELEEHQQMHREQEERSKQALKEMQEELHRAQRLLEAGGGAAAASGDAAAAAPAIDDAELQALREELEILREEKAALNNDIEEVTTDLTRVQEENEALTEELEALKAAGAAGGSADGAAEAPSADDASRPADLELIASLTAELEAARAAQAAAEASSARQLTLAEASSNAQAERMVADAKQSLQLKTEHAAQLAAKQAELDAALAQVNESVAAQAQLAAQLATASAAREALEATLSQERKAHEERTTSLQKREQELSQQLSELTAARAADAAAADSSRAALAASLAEQTAAAKSAASSLALAQGELRAAQQLAAANAGDKEQLAAQRSRELAEQLAALQARIDQSESEREQADGRVAQAEAKLSATQTQLGSLRAELAAQTQRLRDELAAAQQGTAQARSDAAAQAAALRAELEQARSVAASAAATPSSSSGASYDSAASELLQVREQLRALESAHASQSSELLSLQSQLRVEQDLHAAFEHSFQESESKRAGLQAQLQAEQEGAATATAVTATNGKKKAPGTAASSSLRDRRRVSTTSTDDSADELSLQLNGHDGLLSESELASPLPGQGQTPYPSASPALSSGSGNAPTEQVGELSSKLRSTLDALSSEAQRAAQEPSQALVPLVSTLSGDVDASLRLLGTLQTDLAEASERELDLIGKLQDSKGSNIRVFCRVRPLLPHELSATSAREENLLAFPSEHTVSIRTDIARRNRSKLADVPSHRGHTNSLPDATEHSADYANPAALAAYTPFAFDRVFQPQDGQETVFETVKDVVLPVLNGFRACIFAYGQTGSGKTFTMGAEVPSSAEDFANAGITYRSLALLFRSVAQRGASYRYELRLSVLELYNENWRDLLEGATEGKDVVDDEDGTSRDAVEEGSGDEGGDDDAEDAPSATASGSKKAKLFVRKGHNGHYVEGASRRVVSSVEEAMALLSYSYTKRACESTALNESSSRSHLLLQLDVVGVNLATQVTSFGRLSLVDLAGSERVEKSGVSGARLKEALSINKSLAALSDVFIALTDTNANGTIKARHVPFRNSKLTMLLQDSFVGASRTLMFANISPSAMHAGETLCSLQFAARARQVRLSNAQASLDGWGLKYKEQLRAQQTAFANREKSYQSQFKSLKLAVKTKTAAFDAAQAELKLQSDKVSELSRALDRSEADRLKALTAALPGSSTRDKRLEATEDRKWASLQTDLQAAQAKAAEAKAQMERANNDWKDKYAALEAQLKETTEKLRLARLESKGVKPASTFGGEGDSAQAGGAAGGAEGDAAQAQAEVAALTRKVALLELEVKRLKLVQRSQPSLRSPHKPKAPSTSSASLSVATADEEGSASAGAEEEQPSASPVSAPPSAPSSTRSSLLPGSSVSASTGIPAPSPSNLRPPSALPRTTASSTLAAAKQAALLAQKRAQEAQSKSSATASEDAAPAPYVVGSILAKRQSLLPPSSKVAAAASRSHARMSSTGSERNSAAVSPNLGPTAGSATMDDLQLEDATARSEDGSEMGDVAPTAAKDSAASAAARRTSTVLSAARRSKLSLASGSAAGASSGSTRLSRSSSSADTVASAPSSTVSYLTSRSNPYAQKVTVGGPGRPSTASPPGTGTTAGAAPASSSGSFVASSVGGKATAAAPASRLVKPASKVASGSEVAASAVEAPAAAPVRSMLRPPTTLAFPAPTASSAAAGKK